jgi:hypothetical protein
MNFLEYSGVLLWVVLIIPFLVTLLRRGSEGVEWRVKIALGWDILFGAFFNGEKKQYISTRVGLSVAKGHNRVIWLAWIIDRLFLILAGQKNHCRSSIE